MKKTVLTFIAIACIAVMASAQVKPHAIGVRFGGGTAFGGEVSYQHGFGEKNRLELDLGFGGNSDYSHIGLVGIYHWVWNIDGGFNWFVGPGAGLGFNSGKDNQNDYFGISLGGQIGLEYHFNIPLQLSLDTRPMYDFLGDGDHFGWGIALGVRYTF